MSSCLLVVLCLLLSACGRHKEGEVRHHPPRADTYDYVDSAPPPGFDLSSVAEPVPRIEAKARYGNHTPYYVYGKRYDLLPRAEGYVARGTASWYGTKFHGRLTSTREPYDMYAYSAAHKTLPLPCYAQVTNLENGRTAIVRINDRGPFVGDRLIDLSYVAAVKLGVHIKGTAPVEVRVLSGNAGDASAPAPTESPSTAPEPAPVAGHWFQQCGAFGERGNAQMLRARLRAAGWRDARILEPTGGPFRVVVGPFAERAAADRAARSLAARGFPGCHVLQR